MNLQISDSANPLTLIDEHGNTVCAFAKCDEETRQVAGLVCALINNSEEVLDSIRLANAVSGEFDGRPSTGLMDVCHYLAKLKESSK